VEQLAHPSPVVDLVNVLFGAFGVQEPPSSPVVEIATSGCVFAPAP